MIQYVLYNPETRLFIKRGRFIGFTYSLDNAKIFHTEWAAKRFREGLFDSVLYRIKEVDV